MILKRFFLALTMLCFAQVAAAQSWSGPGQQAVSYPYSGSTTWLGVRGDGTTTQGGTPPAYSHEPADIGDAAAGYMLTQWQTSSGITRVVGAPEDKMRLECNSSHLAQEDPILFHGLANTGHWHEFVGNSLAGKDSTYATLRMAGKGTCPGGPVNRTAYWHPAMMKQLPSGVVAALRSDKEIFYYAHQATRSPRMTRIPNGFAFIGGVNPADPTNAAILAEIPSAMRSKPTFGANGDGFKGWTCVLSNGTILTSANGTAEYPALQTPTGTDPWAGACIEGSQLYATVFAPSCWDGKNLTSPTGRGHVRYPITFIADGSDEYCPDGWWQVPTFEGKTFYGVGTGGWLDYKEWYLSSDRHGLAQIDWRRPGSTFHFDWMNGWDPVALDNWLVNCTGVTIGATPGNGAGCDSATIGVNEKLLGNGQTSPDTSLSNNPVTDLGIRHYNDGAGRFYPVETGMEINPGHLIHGGMAANDNHPTSQDIELASFDLAKFKRAAR